MSDFWARRKAAVEAEARAEEQARVAASEAEAEAKLAEKTDEEILAELDLCEPEELETPEAVRAFMDSAVPQRLKTRALRRLWRLNPILANVDGLVDYGEDFTDASCVIEDLQTAYQVGKGMLKHVEALAEKEAAEDAVANGAPDEAEAPDQVRDEVDDFQPDQSEDVALSQSRPASRDVVENAAPEVPDQVRDCDTHEPDVIRAPRRMTFTFTPTTA